MLLPREWLTQVGKRQKFMNTALIRMRSLQSYLLERTRQHDAVDGGFCRIKQERSTPEQCETYYQRQAMPEHVERQRRRLSATTHIETFNK